MIIKKLSYENRKTGWNVKELSFDTLTLLVGVSGVGKTQILSAINTLQTMVLGRSVNGIAWDITFEVACKECQWTGSFETKNEGDLDFIDRTEHEYNIEAEMLKCGDEVIVTRVKDKIMYKGHETVKLDSCKSIINLLKEESVVKEVFAGFRKISSLEYHYGGIEMSPFMINATDFVFDVTRIRGNKALRPLEKLFLLRKNGLPEFQDICQRFQDVFPMVESVDFTMGTMFNDKSYPILRIKEKNVDSWIYQNAISTGMSRTLYQIIELTLAEDGDIIIIDEFENGLGVNCINELADFILDPNADIQFIITSHHPYIINAIPVGKWKIVTRQRSDVRTYTAAELGIGEHSRHDAFMQLMQNDKYKMGLV